MNLQKHTLGTREEKQKNTLKDLLFEFKTFYK